MVGNKKISMIEHEREVFNAKFYSYAKICDIALVKAQECLNNGDSRGYDVWQEVASICYQEEKLINEEMTKRLAEFR